MTIEVRFSPILEGWVSNSVGEVYQYLSIRGKIENVGVQSIRRSKSRREIIMWLKKAYKVKYMGKDKFKVL